MAYYKWRNIDSIKSTKRESRASEPQLALCPSQFSVIETPLQAGAAKPKHKSSPTLCSVEDCGISLGGAVQQHFLSLPATCCRGSFQVSEARNSEAHLFHLAAIDRDSTSGMPCWEYDPNCPCPSLFIGWRFYAMRGKLGRWEAANHTNVLLIKQSVSQRDAGQCPHPQFQSCGSKILLIEAIPKKR